MENNIQPTIIKS